MATALSPPRGVGSAVEGMGLVFWILEVRDGRATPFRNLHAGTLARPQEETPESLSYPLPQFLSYIYLLSWIRGWSLSVLHSPHNWASPQAPPLQERWVKPPSPSGACGDEWGWGALLGSLGRHMWGSEQVKGPGQTFITYIPLQWGASFSWGQGVICWCLCSKKHLTVNSL